MPADTLSNPGLPAQLVAAVTTAEPATKRPLHLSETEISILLYVRPWNIVQMLHLARGVWGAGARLQFTSEHRTVDRSGLAAAFDAKYQQTRPGAALHHLTEAEAADIVLRCRLLRSLDPRQARRLLVAMEHAVDHVLTENRPATMLSLTIDSYVMDVFATLCAKRGIRFIGLVPSFVKGHFRITARGEHVDSRLVSEAEIDATLSTLIVKDYRPDFLVQSEREMRRQMWRLWLRNFPKPLWFALRRMMPGQKLNYHYWATQVISQRYWAPWPQSLRGICGSALASLRDDGGLPLLYLPLQMSPEATIDYWSHDTRWLDYENFVLTLIRRYRGKWRFVLKEHPYLLGFRSRGFYARLAAEPNCIIASPKVPSNDLVDLCAAILVCTGTAGFEAALRGKPVISDSKPYYLPAHELQPIASLEGDLPVAEVSTEHKRSLVSFMLSGTLPGRFLNDGTWAIGNPEHVAWSDSMAKSIRRFLVSQNAQMTENINTITSINY